MANLSDYDLFIVTQGLIDLDFNHRISVFKAVGYAPIKTSTPPFAFPHIRFLERAVLAVSRPCD